MKQIPLTKGQFALVDDADFEWLSQWKWCYKTERSGGYAKRDKRGILMHRVINKTPDGMQTDHIDGNKLNNQRDNLRSTTQSQNQMNRGAPKSSPNAFKGVHKRKDRWRAQIQIEGIAKHLGTFATEFEAALAYNAAAIKYHGEFARLNEVA